MTDRLQINIKAEALEKNLDLIRVLRSVLKARILRNAFTIEMHSRFAH